MGEENTHPKLEVIKGGGEGAELSDAARRARRLVLHVAREKTGFEPEQELAMALAGIEDGGHLRDVDVFLLHQAMVIGHEIGHQTPRDLGGYVRHVLARKPSDWNNENWAVVLDSALDMLAAAYDFMDEAPLTVARQQQLLGILGESAGYRSEAWQDDQLVEQIINGLKLSYEIARAKAAPGENPHEFITAIQKELAAQGIGGEPPMPETEEEMRQMQDKRAKLTVESMGLLKRTLQASR